MHRFVFFAVCSFSVVAAAQVAPRFEVVSVKPENQAVTPVAADSSPAAVLRCLAQQFRNWSACI